jgi:hypothetical protein
LISISISFVFVSIMKRIPVVKHIVL